MKASDARKYIEEGSVSDGCKELIFAILDAADGERELTQLEEQEIHALLDVEVKMANLEIELIQGHLDDLQSFKETIEDALDQTAVELDQFKEQLELELSKSSAPPPPSTGTSL